MLFRSRPLTRGRLAVPSRGCGAFPCAWCERTCGPELRGHHPQDAGRLPAARAHVPGLGEGWWPAVVAGAGGSAGSGPRPPPARRLPRLGGGSAGLLLPTVLTCTQGRVTSPASPPQPAASRRSAAAPEASAALRAPQSRGHGLSDTSGPGASAASAAGAAVAASAPHSSPSHRLAGSLSRPRGHLFRPPSEARGTDGRPRRPRAGLRVVAR